MEKICHHPDNERMPALALNVLVFMAMFDGMVLIELYSPCLLIVS
jgi:hypothetical protein